MAQGEHNNWPTTIENNSNET